MLETAWEDRWVPGFKKQQHKLIEIEQAEEEDFRDCQPGPAGKGCYRIEITGLYQ